MKNVVAVVMVALSMAGAAQAGPADRLDAARMLIFDRDWPRAVAELRRVIQDRKEPVRDEATFWLAHSLFHMGSQAEALRVIESLEREYPRSRWVLVAQSLRVEIATEMRRPDLLWNVVVTPRAEPPRPPVATATASQAPKETPRPPAITFTDVRIQALSGLLHRDPARAVPVLRDIVVEELETPHARRALFVLGLSPHEEAREIVIHFARTGPEPLQVVAIEQLRRWPTPAVRRALSSVYGTSSERVKLAVLRSLGEARADRELIRIARTESNQNLRTVAIAQLRQIDSEPARAFLRTLK